MPWVILEAQPLKDDQIRKNLEPVILEAVDQELAKKGFKRVTSGQPDLISTTTY